MSKDPGSIAFQANHNRIILATAFLVGSLSIFITPALAGSDEDLFKLFERHSCPKCRLQDADLIHANLRDSNLKGAQLQRANLSRALLDGANLSGADLSFTSLQGASLRGADLRGAKLEGTDLRQSDLSGALLDGGALARSYWQNATGIRPGVLTYPELHNSGVEAALSGRAKDAESLFSEAIKLQPEAAITWAARGFSRNEQGKTELAVRDLNYAAALYEQGGDQSMASELHKAATALASSKNKASGGNGIGGQILSGAAGIAQALLPLAAKFLIPMGF